MGSTIKQALREIGWLGGREVSVRKAQSTNSRQTKRHKTKSRSSARTLKRMTVMNANDVDFDVSDMHSDWSSKLRAIVMVSGMGKTYLANRYGWLDCDALIDTKVREEVEERMYEQLVCGASWGEARCEYIEMCRDTLDMLWFQEEHVILVHDVHTASELGIPILGVLTYFDDETIEQQFIGKDRCRKTFALMNNRAVLSQGLTDNVVGIKSVEEAEQMANVMAGINGFPIAAPGRYGDWCPTTSHLVNDYLTGGYASSIDDVIVAEQQGLIPEVTVINRLRQGGLDHYKGYGVTMNDWAKVMARARTNAGAVPEACRDWVPLGSMDAKNLGHYLKLGAGADLDYLLERHKFSHPKFVLNVLTHWKTLGIGSLVNKQLLKLYGLPHWCWSRVHTGVRRLMIRSETFMGVHLPPHERHMLLDLHNLRITDAQSFRQVVLDHDRDYVATHAGVVADSMISEGLNRISPPVVAGTVTKHDIDSLAARRPKEVEMCGISEGSGLGVCEGATSLRSQIACLLVAHLRSRWREVDGEVRLARCALIIHKIMLDWHRVAITQDEWSHTILRWLSRPNQTLAILVCGLISCDYSEACSGDDWSVRVYKAMQRLIVAATCAQRSNLHMSVVDGEIVMQGCGRVEMMRAMADANMPRHMLWFMGESDSRTVAYITKLRNIEKSPTFCLLQMLFLEELLPIQSSLDTRIAAMAYCIDRYESKIGKDVIKAILSVYYKDWLGGHLSDRRMREMTNYTFRKESGVPDGDGNCRVFRREFKTDHCKSGVRGSASELVEEALLSVGKCHHFKRYGLVPDANNPETIICRVKRVPVGSTAQAVERMTTLSVTIDSVTMHNQRSPGEVGDKHIYGCVGALIGNLVDRVSANPQVRREVAGGLWHLMPDKADMEREFTYELRNAVDDIANCRI
nr:hypothetical protein [Aspergillus ochraceopetaliformis chrysovirus 1]